MAVYIKAFVVDFWTTVAQMSPYLLFGFFVAGILSVLVSQQLVERHLGGKGFWPLVKASVFGVPLPLCSCGVIPVSMSLHKHGASKGATVSFLLSTPQTGVDSIFVTYSLLGLVFAIFRPLVAFATGIFGGAVVALFDRKSAGNESTPAKCSDTCCGGGGGNKLIKGLKFGFVELPADIGRAMLVGLAVAALISVVVPDDFFAETLPAKGPVAMLAMMIMGIPVYVCATASVPIAAVLIAKGLSPGVALVFLITGPATNAASLTTIWKVLGARTAGAYLFTVAFSAVGSGLLLDAMFPHLGSVVGSHIHRMAPSLIGQASAVVLLIVLSLAVVRSHKGKKGG
jgi:uncharacterized membrane protein YraQ (UPF0718 family)